MDSQVIVDLPGKSMKVMLVHTFLVNTCSIKTNIVSVHGTDMVVLKKLSLILTLTGQDIVSVVLNDLIALCVFS